MVLGKAEKALEQGFSIEIWHDREYWGSPNHRNQEKKSLRDLSSR